MQEAIVKLFKHASQRSQNYNDFVFPIVKPFLSLILGIKFIPPAIVSFLTGSKTTIPFLSPLKIFFFQQRIQIHLRNKTLPLISCVSYRFFLIKLDTLFDHKIALSLCTKKCAPVLGPVLSQALSPVLSLALNPALSSADPTWGQTSLRISRGVCCCSYSFCCLKSHHLFALACSDPEIASAIFFRGFLKVYNRQSVQIYKSVQICKSVQIVGFLQIVGL
jgi:hypothetical protein